MSEEVVKMDQVVVILEKAPTVLLANQAISDKIKAVKDAFEIEVKEGMTAPSYEKAKKCVDVGKVRLKEMEDARKPITQIITAISKQYTQAEANVKDYTAYFKAKCDEYVTIIEKERKEKERLAALELQKEVERNNYKAACKVVLNAFCSDKIIATKTNLQTGFNAITLESIDADKAKIEAFAPKLSEQYFLTQIAAPLNSVLTVMECKELFESERTTELFKTLNESYQSEISAFKLQLLANIPAKKEELIVAKQQKEEAEKLRIELEKANQDKVKQAEIKAQQEKLEAEKAQLEKDKLEREASEKAQLEKEKLEAENKAKIDAETQAKAASMLQEIQAMATVSTVEIKSVESFEIEILNVAAWAEFVDYWLVNEGCKLDNAKIGAMTLARAKAWCESRAKKLGKEGGFFESKNFKYNEVYKSK